MVNLVKVTSATDLAARLKQSGSRIPRDTVLRESTFIRSTRMRRGRLIIYFSGCQSTRPGHCNHFHRHVIEGSHLNYAHQHSLQVQRLLTQPVFRRLLLLAAPGTGAHLDLPRLQQDSLLPEPLCRQLCTGHPR